MVIEYDLVPEDVVALHQYHLAHPMKSQRAPSRRTWIFLVYFGLLGALGLPALFQGEWFGASIFALIAFVVLLVMTVFWRRLTAWQVRRALRQGTNAKTLGWRRLEITPESLMITTDDSTTTAVWSGLERLVGTDEHAFFYFSPDTAHILPRHAFTTEDTFWEFVETARRYRREDRQARKRRVDDDTQHYKDRDTNIRPDDRAGF